MPKAKGVIRIDSDSTHGWQVRVYRHGKTYSKLFSDRKSGGKEEAFQQAVEYRKSLEAEVAAMPESAPRRRLIRRNKNNSTGVVGISRTFKRDRRGVKHEVYAVSWNPEPGVARGTSFSIKKYGEDTAFKMACKLRWEKMKAIYGDRYRVPSYLDLYRQKGVVDEKAKARAKRS
ncbi:MAG: AP2 domain-containing protein [Rhodothermaceae bacterium]|nr:AP2 domain-containing protein [Rhodothermaceae bacterium]